MNEYERKQLLERVGREGATVGTDIPETIEIDGESLDLRALVFEARDRDTIPAEQGDHVDAVKTNLRRERTRRFERLESGTLSYDAGEELVESIIGIDRALHALENVEPADVEAERDAATTADQKRWMQFLQQALGQDDQAGDRRTRGGP